MASYFPISGTDGSPEGVGAIVVETDQAQAGGGSTATKANSSAVAHGDIPRRDRAVDAMAADLLTNAGLAVPAERCSRYRRYCLTAIGFNIRPPKPGGLPRQIRESRYGHGRKRSG